MTLVIPPPQEESLLNVLTGGGHWRTRDGELILSVPNKTKDGYHTTTLRDARVLGLNPSVTTVLQIIDKPLVDAWKVEKALDAYIAHPLQGKAAAIESMRDIVREASELGTAIHAAIEQGFRGQESVRDMRIAHIVKGFWQWYSTSGLDCHESEHTFVNLDLGYNGTVDFEGTLNGEEVIADFKTDDSETLRDFQYHEPEYSLQLAGYDIGLGQNRKRLSIKISRQVPGLVGVKVWADNERWNEAWLSLFRSWQYVKNYYPGKRHGLEAVSG